MELVNTRPSRFYAQREDGSGHKVVAPGARFNGSAEEAKLNGIEKVSSDAGKAYLHAHGAPVVDGLDDDATLAERMNADQSVEPPLAPSPDDDIEPDRAAELIAAGDSLSRALSTAKLRNPFASEEDLIAEAQVIIEREGDGHGVGNVETDPATGAVLDPDGPDAAPPLVAADGRPLPDADALAGTHGIGTDTETGGQGGTITAFGHPEAMKGAAPVAPGTPDYGEAKFASAAAENAADSLVAARKADASVIAAVEGSGKDGAITTKDLKALG